MNRTPPLEVRRTLRREVGFGCPVEGCGNPYLYWHHFDPTWKERPHHDPAGMIALCGEHHPKADAGAFSKEQLRMLKERGASGPREVRGQFDWMRRELIAVIGGCFYLETTVMVEFRGEPVIWFNRDEDGHLLLNFRMLTTSGEPRMRLEDNYWLPRGDPDDLECPPNGRLLRVAYANGDTLQIEFFELMHAEDVVAKYPTAHRFAEDLKLPLTAVEIRSAVGGTDVEFGPLRTTLPGRNVIEGMLVSHCRVGLSIS